ncbi:MAG TPA: MarR family transcriptional regulator [Pseudonocardia sp.]|jgi:DNA-binding MarR family transcriptional regulator|nr:MarR family transcriptional regulator [Pseudonocardia sp.]
MSTETERLADQIGEFRRAAMPGLLVQLAGGFAGLDLSLAQVATLYLLTASQELGTPPTVREVAQRIGRSVSATSRLVDRLVSAGLVDRWEDPSDRRAKRLTLTDRGQGSLREFERTRARAQLELARYLSTAEQSTVADAMALLALAARRHRDGADPTAD